MRRGGSSDDETPAPAATVLLLRDEPAFEVLMIARHVNSAFAGGALVFPGGRVDPGDSAPDWSGLSTGLSGDPRIAAAQIASIREAFEEAGILLARDASGEIISAAHTKALNEWRSRIEKNDLLFLDLIRSEKLTLACDALHLFSHWVAPPGLHRRFDTLFFAARFPEGQVVLEDGNEATAALWISPRAALAARQNGARKIIFPTACNLGLLGQSESAAQTFDFAARRPIPPVTPAVVDRDGELFLRIPADLGYPITEEAVDLARPD